MRAQIAIIYSIAFILIYSILPGVSSNFVVSAQSYILIPSDSGLVSSVDSLRMGIDELTKERNQLLKELRQLSSQIEHVEERVSDQFTNLETRHEALNRHLDVQFDTLQALIPDEELLQSATFYIRYLNQRQDSLIAYVERLESELDNIPDKHYWGVRNDFKEFDHLLLFTFLGAIMSLGLVLLLRGDNKQEQSESKDQLTTYLKQEDHIDRLSMSITLLVGSILVLLFIIFIL